MPTLDQPTFTLKVAGSTFPLLTTVSTRLSLERLTGYSRDGGIPTLELSVSGGAMQPASDPLRGKSCELLMDVGAGNVSLFVGDFRDRPINYSNAVGWHRRYTAVGLRDRMDRVPFSGDDTPDTTFFNLDASDPNVYAPRTGRTIGEIIRQCLDNHSNSANLISQGIGGYTSSGSGATATCAVAAGAITGTPTVTAGGSGYGSAVPTVIFRGGGGYGGAGTATLTAGVVTAVTVTNAGHGYTSAPEIWISALPAVTLNDLFALQTVYPSAVRVGGEKLGSAIESTLKELAPNSFMHVLPTGIIRFYDLRALGRPYVTFLNSGGSGAKAEATVVAGVITAYTVTAGGTSYDSGNPPTVLIIDALGSGALATCTVVAGAVTAVAVTAGGTGYSSPVTLTIGTDLVDVHGVVYNSSVRSCFQRVVVRGQDHVQALYFDDGLPPGVTTAGTTNGIGRSFTHDSLVTNAAAIAAWKLGDFSNPLVDGGQATAIATINTTTHVVDTLTLGLQGYGYTGTAALRFIGGGGSGATGTCTMSGGKVTAVTLGAGGTGYTSIPAVVIDTPTGAGGDAGTCTCPTTTTITVTSSHAGKTWATNYWDQTSTGHQGEVVASINTNTGITAKTRCTIVSNTSLTAGGTSTLTVTPALPSTSYQTYTIVGLAGGASSVWRKWVLTNPDMIAGLKRKFPRPTAWHNFDGTAATMVNFPVASVLYSATGLPPYAESPIGISLDTSSGIILTAVPMVTVFGTNANLVIGGASTDGIGILRVLLPIATSHLTATYPPDSGGPVYAGTSHTIDGMSDTLTITIPQWRDDNNSGNMVQYAADLFDSVSDVVQELTIPMVGIYPAALQPGLAVNLAHVSVTTGLESAKLPAISGELTFNLSGAPRFTTHIMCSSRRAHHTAALYERPPVTGIQLGISEGGEFVAGSIAGPSGSGDFSGGLPGSMMPGPTILPDATRVPDGPSALGF